MRAALVAFIATLAACAPAPRERLEKPVPRPRPEEPPDRGPVLRLGRLLAVAPCTQPPPPTINLADALSDLDDLEVLLRRGYAGFEVLGFHGVNWDRELQAMHDELRGMTFPMVTEQFRTWLAKRLGFIGDPSMVVSAFDDAGKERSTSVGIHRDAYALDVTLNRNNKIIAAGDKQLLGAFLLRCRDATEVAIFLDSPSERGGRLVLRAATPPAPTTCTVRLAEGVETTVTLPFHRVSVGGVNKGPAFELKDGPAAVVRVRSLDDETAGPELQQLDASSRRLLQRQAIVLDLRGAAPGEHDLAPFFQAMHRKLELAGSRVLDSEVIAQGEVNAITCSGKPIEEQIEGGRVVVERLHEGRAERTWMRAREVGAVARFRPSRAYPGVLVLVVDAHCTGSCEAAIAMARQLPRTLIVGENTGGDGQVISPLRYHLASSNLWITTGTEVIESMPPMSDGAEPDLWIDGDKPDDALDAIIRCAIDPSCAREIVVSR